MSLYGRVQAILTQNAGPELEGTNKTKGRNVRVENGGPILNTENEGPEIRGPENA